MIGATCTMCNRPIVGTTAWFDMHHFHLECFALARDGQLVLINSSPKPIGINRERAIDVMAAKIFKDSVT